MQAADGLPQLISQLERGTSKAARAALRIDATLRRGGETSIAHCVKLGGVPRLVGLLRAGPRDMAARSALCALEALWQGSRAARDEGREVRARVVKRMRTTATALVSCAAHPVCHPRQPVTMYHRRLGSSSGCSA